MKKVLVISYFFPPCGLTAAQRAQSWLEGFPNEGIYPIVVTRKWETPIRTLADIGYTTSEGVAIEEEEHYRIHRVPHKATFKDKIFIRFGDLKFVFVRRLLSFFEILLELVSIRTSIYGAMYDEARNVCAAGDVDMVIISGNPFPTFKIGYLLKREFGIPWVADYRDAWSTSEINGIGRSLLFGLINYYDMLFEKHWVGTASRVISVSEPLAKRIGKLTGTPYDVIENGYHDNLFDEVPDAKKYNAFTVTYIGTLYYGQKVEKFLTAAWEFAHKNGLKPNQFKIMFPGLGIDQAQTTRVLHFNAKLRPYISVTDRLPQEEILLMEKRSDVLLFVGWLGFEGIVPSKIYEYCGSRTPLLVAPGDKGEVNRIISETKAGKVCDTVAEVVSYLEQRYAMKQAGVFQNEEADEEAIERLKRSYQTRKLATLLKSI